MNKMKEKFNYQQILERLQEMYSDVSEFAHEGLYYDIPNDFEPLPESYEWEQYQQRERNYHKTQPLGECVQVQQHGGEGEGEQWYVVYHFVEHDIYVRVDGWYQSYEGTDFYDGWDCCKEVRPKEKVITVYES
jgi:hypothetical protein